jgi:hypothetical protein
MTRMRLLIAAVTAAALAGLFTWQLQREQLVKACLDGGGVWHGPKSACKSPRPLLQRDLQRS